MFARVTKYFQQQLPDASAFYIGISGKTLSDLPTDAVISVLSVMMSFSTIMARYGVMVNTVTGQNIIISMLRRFHLENNSPHMSKRL